MRVSHSVHLLYLTDDTNQQHYVAIKNLSRLVSGQLNFQKSTTHFCDVCLTSFTKQEDLDLHIENDCWKVITVLPLPGTKIKFENHQYELKAPFTVYADFECILQAIHGCELDPSKSSSKPEHFHKASSFSYLIKCSFNE